MIAVLTQPKYKPRVVELHILLLAFACFGLIDRIGNEKFQALFKIACIIIKKMFQRSDLNMLTKFFRYLKNPELLEIIGLLLRFIFLRQEYINTKKKENKKN